MAKDTGMFGWKHIWHYYGDTVRAMFLAAAIVFAIAMPLFGNLIPVGDFEGIAIILLLALLAGATSPNSRFIMAINVIVSAGGVYLLQSAAITLLHSDSLILFLLREVSVILFLIAFYESVKTVRSMLRGKVGQEPTVHEFDKRS